MQKVRAKCNWCSHASPYMQYQTEADYAGVQHAKQAHNVESPAQYTDYQFELNQFCDYCGNPKYDYCGSCGKDFCSNHKSELAGRCYQHEKD